MTNEAIPSLLSGGHIRASVNGALGLITLARPEAMNALSLAMVRDLTQVLKHWAQHPQVQAVVLMGQGRDAQTPVFCAGGDIRFFHRAALAGDPDLAAFFTEEYALNHLIHHFPKPTIALMDGVVMGGGMGLAQGAKLRVVSERSRLAMPETQIGFFPDVGGGWFLGQLPGHVGEWLALTGQTLGAGDAVELGLADVFVPAQEWDALLDRLQGAPQPHAEHVVATVMERAELAPDAEHLAHRARIDRLFGQADLGSILNAVSADQGDAWGSDVLQQLQHNSPLMMAVSLALVRRARRLGLADCLRLERVLAHQCFASHQAGGHSETVEGIRALAVDKDRMPRWQPPTVADLEASAVEAFFADPWPSGGHPLAGLA